MQKVFIHNCSANAGRMLARFSYGNENLKNLMNEIVSEETRLEDNCIIAEIVHLPEERTGNILRRPHLYKYELPYLCNSTLHEDNLISLNELEVKILNGEIILYSNKLQARILPKLTNAHNYRKSHSSVYQFLCDLQFQNHGNIGFDWAGLREIYDYMPRLIYDDVILSKAQWKLNSQILGASLNSGDHTIDLLKIWQENMNVPRYISVVQGDKRLCLDLSNDDCLEILMDLVLKTRIIWLEESFINPKHQVITDGEGVYTHEIIIPFYKR